MEILQRLSKICDKNNGSALDSLMDKFVKLTLSFIVSLTTFFFILAFVGCSKEEMSTPNQDTTAPIHSVRLENRYETRLGTIRGSGFGKNLEAIKVYINDEEEVVQNVTDEEITVLVSRRYSGSPKAKVWLHGQFILEAVLDYYLNKIQVNTLAGSTEGYAEGVGVDAKFNQLMDIEVDDLGNTYVSEWGNRRIRKISPTGHVSTYINGNVPLPNGPKINQISSPYGIARDKMGNIYLADANFSAIQKFIPGNYISPGIKMTTLAGGTYGYKDGPGATAKFYFPADVDVDEQGNVYVADYWDDRIRKINPSGYVTTLAGGTMGFADGPGAAAKFNSPYGVAVDSHGNVYVADKENHKIRKITPNGYVSTVAGSGVLGFQDGLAATAKFSLPSGVALDEEGNIYVADSGNSRIRKITPSGYVITLAGSSTKGQQDGPGLYATFGAPRGITVDTEGTIYVTDGSTIRKITQQ